jgi:ATP-dependent RNA helicase DeaD
MASFEALGLRAELLQSLQDIGFTTPTPVQEQAIPMLLQSEKDVVALAQTGTGKTAAFGCRCCIFWIHRTVRCKP